MRKLFEAVPSKREHDMRVDQFFYVKTPIHGARYISYTRMRCITSTDPIWRVLERRQCSCWVTPNKV